ncbi:hypothetical protein Pst134EA_013547 [Puccinia striiformis f. sp. tritici]|uniref:hypothetical protein n=1 Tax=Puccinia striiformis f. sp. tritici TaxID=168172 RepID=UPI002008CC64|nr:hypothetical protein Pst134EA_013547 [Puccinia striiformis f. sp. tritici]KAH9465664.1 hypothetical protein Pst134EA_013547 [Puccinia striiformis f. sp. tritici]
MLASLRSGLMFHWIVFFLLIEKFYATELDGSILDHVVSGESSRSLGSYDGHHSGQTLNPAELRIVVDGPDGLCGGNTITGQSSHLHGTQHTGSAAINGYPCPICLDGNGDMARPWGCPHPIHHTCWRDLQLKNPEAARTCANCRNEDPNAEVESLSDDAAEGFNEYDQPRPQPLPTDLDPLPTDVEAGAAHDNTAQSEIISHRAGSMSSRQCKSLTTCLLFVVLMIAGVFIGKHFV